MSQCGASARLGKLVAIVLVSVQLTCADEPLPRVPPLEPAEALKSFETHPGFEMQLIAAEPLVTDPVAMVYDENGLAYVAEMSDYPYTDKTTDKPFVERTMDRPIGRVRVLDDTDGDGDFDRGTIFAEELSWPTGLALWKGGVFVAATPDIWYLKDTDGDHRADVRQKVFTGFRKFNVQAVMNNLVWGLDHRIYGAGSSNGGQIRPADQPDAKPWTLARNDFRFDPRNRAFELISGGARFGNTFDDWGNRFVCNIRNPVQHVVLPSRYLARNPYLPVATAVHDAAESGDALPVYRIGPPEEWRVVRAARMVAEANPATPRSETNAEGYFTSSSGLTIYRGAAWPREFYGDAFLGEVAGNLVHRQVLSPNGVTFRAVRGDVRSEFVRSRDNWFRPVNYVNAPDGTLHILDMYRETIEHPWSIPDDIKAQLDLESGRDRGRIYRLAPVGFRPPKPPRLGEMNDAELVAQLASPNSWWRETAHRLLFERQSKDAVEPLRKLLAESENPLARLHALWSLEGVSALTDGELLAAMVDDSPGVREHAVRIAEIRLPQSSLLAKTVIELAGDDEIRVRFQVAFTLGEIVRSSADAAVRSQASAALAKVARRDAGDIWVRTAVLSSANESASALLGELLADKTFLERDEPQAMIRDLASVVGARNKPPEIGSLVAAFAKLDAKSDIDNGVIIGLGNGLRRAGRRLADVISADSPAARRLDRIYSTAESTAADAATGPDKRLAAIDLLATADFSRSSLTLAALVAPREPQTMQMAAIRALSGYANGEVAGLLLANYATLTPGVRGEVVQALLARADRIGPLLDAVETRRVPPADIPPARRTLLVEHRDPAIRDRASRLLAGDNKVRNVALAQYRSALEKQSADPGRGQAVFQRECQTCHRLGERGHNVGPNLLSIRNRAPAEVLANVLDPNREVAPNFQEYIVLLDDGRTITGIITEETATSITIRRAEAVEETVLRQNIEEISGTGRSLMPEGFEKKIPPSEMADLIAFLLRG